MRFHQRLAPYKLGLLYNSDCSEEFTTIANYIHSELRDEGILVKTSENNSAIGRYNSIMIG